MQDVTTEDTLEGD